MAKPAKEFKPSIDGLKEISTPDIDGWWAPKEGDAFEGQVMGAIKIKNQKGGGSRLVVLVRIKGECNEAVLDKKPVKLKQGEILAVGIKYKNRELLDYVEKRGVVACQAIEKISIGGGQTMWQFRVWGNPDLKVPWVDTDAISAGAPDGGSGGDDDIPF